MNSQDFRNLQEAYLNVYENEQLDESIDIFDYVMEYLISEGYADNEEAAESIMVNMGEEWIHTIVEKFSMAANPSKPQSPIPTKLPTSSKKLKTRAITVIGTQKRQDKEIGLR